MITQLKFVGIPVKDQQRALTFYTEKMGFKIHTDQPFNDNQRWIELRIGHAETQVVLFTPDGHEDRVGGFFNGAFFCDDIQKTYEELGERGVEFTGPPKKEPWGTFVTFKDSEGNQFVMSAK